MIFFITTLVVISFIYHLILKFLFDKNKDRFERWFLFLLINGCTFVVNYFAFKGLSEIEKTDHSIAYPIGITILMFIIRGIYELIFNPSNRFLSTEEESLKYKIFPARDYKKVVESDSDKIAIYPRITIRDIEIEEKWNNEISVKKNISEVSTATKESFYSKHIIFDSSDFIVINKTFGVFDNLQESFTQGKKFKFKDGQLLAEKVQVDFMNIYDDYSGGIMSKHTNAYEGKDTPYNIQIIVWARRIKEGSEGLF